MDSCTPQFAQADMTSSAFDSLSNPYICIQLEHLCESMKPKATALRATGTKGSTPVASTKIWEAWNVNLGGADEPRSSQRRVDLSRVVLAGYGRRANSNSQLLPRQAMLDRTQRCAQTRWRSSTSRQQCSTQVLPLLTFKNRELSRNPIKS
jgi:hypothetical protein